jgi:hypothetical protein
LHATYISAGPTQSLFDQFLRPGTFDEVQLTAVALRASKRPQVLAPHARLNHRQSHGRIASDALRALVLFVEHTLPLCWAGEGRRAKAQLNNSRRPKSSVGQFRNHEGPSATGAASAASGRASPETPRPSGRETPCRRSGRRSRRRWREAITPAPSATVDKKEAADEASFFCARDGKQIYR